MSISQNIKKISKQKNIQQKELAEAFGVTEQTMTNYLTGRTKIIADQLPMFAKLLRVQIEDLFREPDKKYKPEPKSESITKDPKVVGFSCPDCAEKQKEIDLLNDDIMRLKNKLYETQEKYTDVLEELQNKKEQGKCG